MVTEKETSTVGGIKIKEEWGTLAERDEWIVTSGYTGRRQVEPAGCYAMMQRCVESVTCFFQCHFRINVYILTVS